MDRKPKLSDTVVLQHPQTTEPTAAIVTAVYEDDSVDVTVFRRNAQPELRERVPFDEKGERGSYAFVDVLETKPLKAVGTPAAPNETSVTNSTMRHPEDAQQPQPGDMQVRPGSDTLQHTTDQKEGVTSPAQMNPEIAGNPPEASAGITTPTGPTPQDPTPPPPQEPLEPTPPPPAAAEPPEPTPPV